jgi:hypothetical protein
MIRRDEMKGGTGLACGRSITKIPGENRGICRIQIVLIYQSEAGENGSIIYGEQVEAATPKHLFTKGCLCCKERGRRVVATVVASEEDGVCLRITRDRADHPEFRIQIK